MECEEDYIMYSVVVHCAGSSSLIVFSHCFRKSKSDNVRDKNAFSFIINVEVDNAFQSIGYVPMHDLHNALKNLE